MQLCSKQNRSVDFKLKNAEYQKYSISPIKTGLFNGRLGRAPTGTEGVKNLRKNDMLKFYSFYSYSHIFRAENILNRHLLYTYCISALKWNENIWKRESIPDQKTRGGSLEMLRSMTVKELEEFIVKNFQDNSNHK